MFIRLEKFRKISGIKRKSDRNRKFVIFMKNNIIFTFLEKNYILYIYIMIFAEE